ncbi:MAG: iron ABC transporter permease [Acidobacteria bacterium]|nr:iron ABC transporter permease [Acidobacteriota bacterium]MCB9396371.1 iron ABC transporter permease [Acidobacteriota bacterium]
MAAGCIFYLAIAVGAVPLKLSDLWVSGTASHMVLWQIRIPRVLLAFGAGAGLSLAGLVFQTLFANTLATPYTLGVSSGASFGAVLMLFLMGSFNQTGWGVPIGAWLGALLSTAIVGFAAMRGLARQKHAMLLAGVAVTFFFSSLILLLQALSSQVQVFQIMRWLMGGVSVVGYRPVLVMLAVVFGCAIFLWSQGRRLNVLLLGDDLAQSKGLPVQALRIRLFISVSLLIGAIVALVGPIGFIGLVIPHAARLIWGQDHVKLIPICLWVGGLVLVFCDWIGRTAFAPQELPVGVITALLGSPIFFALLLRRSAH